MSREAQTLLGMSEELAVDKPVAELLVPADAEAQGRTGFAAAIAQAADGQDPDTARAVVRPWNTFGVRMRARIATCGPPRAALIVLESGAPRPLRAVSRASIVGRSGLASAAARRPERRGRAAPPEARPSRPPAGRSPAAR